jgi:hypothetical protein
MESASSLDVLKLKSLVRQDKYERAIPSTVGTMFRSPSPSRSSSTSKLGPRSRQRRDVTNHEPLTEGKWSEGEHLQATRIRCDQLEVCWIGREHR